MPEKFEGKILVRSGAVLALAIGSAVLTAEAIDAQQDDEHAVQTAFLERSIITEPVIEEVIEPATTIPATTTTEATIPVTTTTTNTTTTIPPTTTTTVPPAVNYHTDCEYYRPMIEQYDWPVAGAMRTMYEESRCNPNAVSPTDDHGLFQLHKKPVYDPAENIRIAYEMYVDARRGSRNFSAWYAVCTRDLQPKYPEVNCT